MTADQLQHKIDLKLASGARLTLLYFSDRELRLIFSYDYVGDEDPGATPEVVNKVKLVADYEEGLLTSQIVLSMNVVIPGRLGQQFFTGIDLSPGAKTYLEFTYQAPISDLDNRVGDAFRLVEICKGARDRVRLTDVDPALVRPIAFPFPVPDRLPIEYGALRVPFRTNQGDVAHFDLPTRTLR
jgi:hypothetical protein